MRDDLFNALERRLKNPAPNFKRPQGISFKDVEKILSPHPQTIETLWKMEASKGMVDIVGITRRAMRFIDTASEPPADRRNCVYDPEAEAELLKKYPDLKFNGSAVGRAQEFGAGLVGKEDYLHLQSLGNFDSETTWTYLNTPPDIRAKGEALYGFRNADGVQIFSQPATHRGTNASWRGFLVVPK
jgi:hypothetical protein